MPGGLAGRSHPELPLAARTSGVVRSDDSEKLLAQFLQLTQTSPPAYSFARVGRYAFPFFMLVSPPSLPAYPITRLTGFHYVYSRDRIT